jgi:hypothetical protein
MSSILQDRQIRPPPNRSSHFPQHRRRWRTTFRSRDQLEESNIS